jgi:hypothetical protein
VRSVAAPGEPFIEFSPFSCGFATALLSVCVQLRAIKLEEEWKK